MNGVYGDGYVAGDEFDRACLGWYAANRVAAALCLGLADEFLRGVLVANTGCWPDCPNGAESNASTSIRACFNFRVTLNTDGHCRQANRQRSRRLLLP